MDGAGCRWTEGTIYGRERPGIDEAGCESADRVRSVKGGC